MNVVEALKLAKAGRKVRAVSWRKLGSWVEYQPSDEGDPRPFVFIHSGGRVGAMLLASEGALLGEWEEIECSHTRT